MLHWYLEKIRAYKYFNTSHSWFADIIQVIMSASAVITAPRYKNAKPWGDSSWCFSAFLNFCSKFLERYSPVLFECLCLLSFFSLLIVWAWELSVSVVLWTVKIEIGFVLIELGTFLPIQQLNTACEFVYCITPLLLHIDGKVYVWHMWLAMDILFNTINGICICLQ